MKTIEEKDDAVLAELSRMRAQQRAEFVAEDTWPEYPHWQVTKYREDFFAIRRGDSDFLEYVGRTSHDGFSEQVTNEFYRLLGLESAELEARNAALVKSENLHKSVVLKLSKERGDALRRNDALVNALVEIRKPWYVFNLGKRASLKNTLEQYKTRCMAIHEIATRAIEANGKEASHEG